MPEAQLKHFVERAIYLYVQQRSVERIKLTADIYNAENTIILLPLNLESLFVKY